MADVDVAPIDLAAIEEAASVLDGVAVITPVLTSNPLDRAVGAAVLAKAEGLQRTGSFKFRGAYTRLSAIAPAERSLGVVAVSSGNHGAAVAAAAHLLGMAADVFVPADAPAVKMDLITSRGATVHTFEPGRPDRETPALEFAAATGATFVHPFEDPLVQAGQGTTALELHRQAGALDVLVVPMSGGGLMAGCASAMHALDPGCELVGVEPAGADDTVRSFRAGEPVRIASVDTIAEGLAVSRPGDRTFAINRSLVSDVVTVTDDEIVEAMRTARSAFDLRLEPSGAASLAAVQSDRDRWRGRRVGIVLSGGNVSEQRFSALCGP